MKNIYLSELFINFISISYKNWQFRLNFFLFFSFLRIFFNYQDTFHLILILSLDLLNLTELN